MTTIESLQAENAELRRQIEGLKSAAIEFLQGNNQECCGGGIQNSFDEPPECCAQPVDDFDRFMRRAAILSKWPHAQTIADLERLIQDSPE